jgi:drug/metabolite transporter (DMT)-like permease
LIASGLVVLGAALFSMAMSLAKFLDPTVNSVTLIFARSLAGVIAAMPLFLRVGFITHLKTKKRPLHLSRVLIVTCSIGCTYYAYRNLPLSYAAALGQTGPLFTTILALFFLREQVQWQKWVALGLGYLGVLLIIQPTEGGSIDQATLVALGANMLAGIAIVMSKKLTDTDASETILFYPTFGIVLFSGIGALWFWQTPSAVDLAKLGGMGVLGVLSQYCYLNALKHAPASFVTPFEYTRLCMGIPIGYVLFGEVPDLWVLMGSLVIVLSVFFLVRTDDISRQNIPRHKG